MHGFVPTMGNLHQGHISLVESAAQDCDFVTASIFVNPLQFGAGEDFETYPRTLEADAELLEAAGCTLLFTPDAHQLYPYGLDSATKVIVPDITRQHCGAHRAGHFDGVSTVVSILLNIVQPQKAWFGAKDFQQVAVIKKLVADLHLSVEIQTGETVRESDGLAMSSRNQYLSAEDRPKAAELFRLLKEVAQRVHDGERNFLLLQTAAIEHLHSQGFVPEYFNIVHADTLEAASAADHDIVALVAARLGRTRLIDNIRLRPPGQ